ncbi:hypothetical protein A1O1_04970 [Capronia coronata CBS 617.96]|uniref:NmrA-like domain-containing protein n=1 Tax=Capronia coronata CBS 617.96 TaxID=1182541 RepID=W9Y683_9EURO|nr:uncharacterized protein A1O1_04970 [Capronia coronata CBS 617.96]EXJ88043.1 hypothetical protein A1O1_04970 [Capronia coronata CBS 617.96]
MSKLLVVFGATGQQGGSVIEHVLDDPELCSQYKIRGVTRDTTSATAQALKEKGVEVVQADLDDEPSIAPVLQDAHTIFAMTTPSYSPTWKGSEWAQGKAIADAAVVQGVQYIIFSTLPHVKEISGGKYTRVWGFDAKAAVEEYIRKLPVRSAFFSPGSFMQNWTGMVKPQQDASGDYPVERHISPQTQLPLIDVAGDTGKFVGAILANPDKYEGQVFCAATKLYTMEQICQIMAKATGKNVYYRQISTEEYLGRLPPWGIMLVETMSYQQDFGYYGPQTPELVEWAVENARGKLATFEEYMNKHSRMLD